MKRNPIHKTIQALALLLFAFATVASAANVTLQTADDGTKYVYIPNEDTDYLNISASDIDNGLRTFKIYATNGPWENYKKTRTLEISLPEGSFIGANAGNSKLYRCYMRINGSNTWYTVANKNSLKVNLYTGGNKDANISKFEMTAYIEVPRSISLNSVSVGGSATFFNENAEKRWSKNRMLEGDLITVTAIPEEGYFLKGIEIKKENDILNDVSVGDVDWYSNPTKNIAQFVMPDADISVKPIFVKNPTAEDGFYINMDRYTKYATIPDGIKSFKVHYGGGMSLRITAPSGKSLMVTGTMQTGGYLLISDGESWSTSLKRVSLGGQGAGTATDIGTFVSLDNHVSFDFGTNDNDRLDLTVELLSGSTSLDEDSQQDYKEVSRSEPLIIYSHMKNDRSFWYTLQSRHAVGSEWSDWAALEDKFDGHALDDHIESSYEIDHSFEIPWQNINSNYEYMEFRYSMNPFKENGNLSDERIYTSSVKVRLKNKVNVNVDANKTTSGDYILMTANGTKVDKDQLFDYGTPVKVQAIAPAGFKFLRWANLESENNPVTLSSVVSDTTIRALFEPKNVSEIQVVTYVSKNGDETWSSAEGSPLDVNVTSAIGGKFRVTASVVANEELCDDGNGSKNCYAYIIIRKEGSDTWDTVEAGNGAADYIKVHSGNSYTAEKERSVSYSLLKNASRFEIKTIVKPRVSSDIVIAESNSIYVNLYHTLRVNDYCYSGGSYIGSGMGEGAGSGDCNAIVEDELGNMTTLVPGETITLQYGSKLKLHPLYPYNMVFYSWKDYSKSNSEVYSYEDYITRDSVYEFTLDSNMKLLMGAKYREPDTVRVVPVGQKMPYAGMGEFGLSLSNKGTDGFRMDFASDTAFFIQKRGLSEMFAVNRLDSMFTPGEYTLTVKLINESVYYSERDSLWWCQSYPAVYWMDEFLAPNTGKNIACSEDAPAVYYRRYSFTVRDTSFNVTFNTWDEENGKYVTVGETQKVAFGEVPATPDIDCPESNTDWKFSCNWATAFAPAVKDTAYTYQVVRSNSVLSIASVDGSKTATIAGSYNGNDAFKITETVDVDNVELQRSFNQSKSGFSTIVLPFNFNASALTGVKSVIKFNRMTKNNGKLAVGMGYVWCDADVEASLKAEAAKTENPDNYDHCNSDWETFPGEMEAYTPYMVQMKDNQIGFDYVGGVMFEKTPDESEIQVSKEADDGVWEFRGTTQKKVWTAEETKDGYVWGFAAQIMGPANYIGKFVQLGEGASAEPLRAYMVFKPKDSNPPAQQVAPRNASFAAKPAKSLGTETASLPDEIDVVIESQGKDGEEHRTVIGTFTRSSGEFKMLRDYDLKGRKVNGVNKARGAYYGKKVLKK